MEMLIRAGDRFAAPRTNAKRPRSRPWAV